MRSNSRRQSRFMPVGLLLVGLLAATMVSAAPATTAAPRTAPASAPAATADAAAAGPEVVLDTYGFWRMHHTLQPPVIEADGKLTPITYGFQWMDMETPAGGQLDRPGVRR